MISITHGEWIADLGAMTCWNINNGITVNFELKCGMPAGKINKLPLNFFDQWDEKHNEGKSLQNFIEEAEEIFMTAYFENYLEKICLRKISSNL